MTTSPFSVQKRHHSFLTLIIFLVAFAAAIFFVKPLWDDVSALNLAFAQKQDQKTQLSQQLQSLKDLQQRLQNGSEVEKNTTLDAIPERFEQDKLISDLKAIAQQNQVTVNGMNFSLATNDSDRIKRADITVNLTGSEDGLLSFLKGVEANPRKVTVKLISVQYGKTDSGTVRLNFNLNMETYYQDKI